MTARSLVHPEIIVWAVQIVSRFRFGGHEQSARSWVVQREGAATRVVLPADVFHARFERAPEASR